MVEMDENEEMEVELTWIPLGMANMKSANRSPLSAWSSVLALDACGDCLASASLAAAARASACDCGH